MKDVTIVTDDELLRAAIAEALVLRGLAGRCSAVREPDALEVPPGRFRMGELLDRIKLRGAQGSRGVADFPVGAYILSHAEGTLVPGDGGAVVRLTEKEREILTALHEAGAAGLDRAVLLEKVWGYGAGIETHTLETHIYRLRQKIESDPAAPSILLTDGNGYRLGPVTG